MKDFKYFINKPTIKNIIIAILTTVTSVSMAFLDDFNPKQVNYIYKLIFFISTVIIYIVCLVYYTTQEVNGRRSLEILEKQENLFKKIMINLISICKLNASDISTYVKNIKYSKELASLSWNFDKACLNICLHIYESLSNFGDSNNYEVAYVKLTEYENKEAVVLSAFANQSGQAPTIFGEARYLDISIESDETYHDLVLFKRNSSKTDILFDCNEVNEAFGYKTKEKRKENVNKREQYIGIPVFCDDMKMIGLLEIACYKGVQLGITKEETEEIANKFLVPYANIILLLHKIEKALLININNEEES